MSSNIFEVLRRFLLCWMNAANYWQNDGFLEICSRVWSMLKVCRQRFLNTPGTGHVIQKLYFFSFGSFIEFDFMSENRPKLSRKWWFSGKIVFDSSQCQKCIDKGAWFSLTLATWLRVYNLFYFGSFTEFYMMSEKHRELSRKGWFSGKSF